MSLRLPSQILRHIISQETAHNPERLVKALCHVNQLNLKPIVTNPHEKADFHLVRSNLKIPSRKYHLAATSQCTSYYNTAGIMDGQTEKRHEENQTNSCIYGDNSKKQRGMPCEEENLSVAQIPLKRLNIKFNDPEGNNAYSMSIDSPQRADANLQITRKRLPKLDWANSCKNLETENLHQKDVQKQKSCYGKPSLYSKSNKSYNGKPIYKFKPLYLFQNENPRNTQNNKKIIIKKPPKIKKQTAPALRTKLIKQKKSRNTDQFYNSENVIQNDFIKTNVRLDDISTVTKPKPKKLPNLLLNKNIPTEESQKSNKYLSWEIPKLLRRFDYNQMKFQHKKPTTSNDIPVMETRLDILSGLLRGKKPKKLSSIFPESKMRNIKILIHRTIYPKKQEPLYVNPARVDDVYCLIPNKKRLPPSLNINQRRHYSTRLWSRNTISSIKQHRSFSSENPCKPCYPRVVVQKWPKHIKVGCLRSIKPVTWEKTKPYPFHKATHCYNPNEPGLRGCLNIHWSYLQPHRQHTAPPTNLINFKFPVYGFYNFQRDRLSSAKTIHGEEIPKTKGMPPLANLKGCEACNKIIPCPRHPPPKFTRVEPPYPSFSECKGDDYFPSLTECDHNLIEKTKTPWPETPHVCPPKPAFDGQKPPCGIYIRKLPDTTKKSFSTFSSEFGVKNYLNKLSKLSEDLTSIKTKIPCKLTPKWGIVSSNAPSDKVMDINSSSEKNNLKTYIKKSQLVNASNASAENIEINPTNLKMMEKIFMVLQKPKIGDKKTNILRMDSKDNKFIVALAPTGYINQIQKRNYCKCSNYKSQKNIRKHRSKYGKNKKDKCCCSLKQNDCSPPNDKSEKKMSLFEKIVNYLKARPNCPSVEELRQKELKEKAEIAAKAAGYCLCEKKCSPPSGYSVPQTPPSCDQPPSCDPPPSCDSPPSCCVPPPPKCGNVKKDQSQCNFSTLMCCSRRYSTYYNKQNTFMAQNKSQDLKDSTNLTKTTTTIVPIRQTNYIGKMYQVKLSKIGVKNKLTSKQLDEEPYTYCQICRFVPKNGIHRISNVSAKLIRKPVKNGN